MTEIRKVAYALSIAILVVVGCVAGIVIYEAGYQAGEQAVVDEVIENQKEIVFWSNGGHVNSTLYNMTWYAFGNPSQSPHLTEDGFVMIVTINIKQDDDPSFFDCTINWALQMGNITLERIFHSTEVYNSSENRVSNTFIPANTTGGTILYDCYWILRVVVWGHGTSAPETNVNLLASQVITIRPLIGGD